jgi:xanthine dehydrogenase accessory factor
MTDRQTLRVNDHAAIFSQAIAWLQTGHEVAMATVLKTWGSAPRAAGSFLIARRDGAFEGSVSGGCVEGEVIAQAQSVIETATPKLLEFGVSNAKAWEVGLACGGEIQVLLYPARAEDLQHALAETQAGRSIEFNLPVADAPILILEPAPRLAIIGAVHITQFLAPMAKALGYDVIVIDPRTAFLTTLRFPDISTCADWPDDALAAWKPDISSAIVALTHDPKIDDVALAAALNSDAFYIAALGSRKNHAGRLERLAAQGFSSNQLGRIHGPAGLAIGAATPSEIALSVLAQLTAARRGKLT